MLVVTASACSGDIDKKPADDPSAPNAGASGGNDGNAGGGAGSDAAGSGGAGRGAVPPGSNPGGVETECEATEPGESPLRKLSTLEYRNTVRDLLEGSGLGSVMNQVTSLLAAVPEDSLGDSFRVLDNRISLEHVTAYFNVGVTVGDAIAGDAELLADVAGECATESDPSESCLRDFVERFGELAYRRPLSTEETDELLALDDGERSPSEVVRAIVIVALSSPRFVNHLEIDGSEIGGDERMLQLSGYEIASRLSYLFWQSMPDRELLDAAADGSLATEAGFADQLERVLADDRTRDTLWQFWHEWLRLERFTGFETTRPGFMSLAEGEQIGDAGHDHYGDMVQEIRDLTELFTFERTSTLGALLATDESVTRSEDLARLYGVSAWDGSGEYPRFAAGERAGLLQRGALLVSNLETTNPFHRGALVRKNLLCDPLAQPDPNSLPPGSLDPPPITEDQTTRERFEAKVEGNATCAGCHNQFSAIGFALESFDALGRYRTTEIVYDEQTGEQLAELPIDGAGVPRIALTDEQPVMDAAELNQRIVDSKKVETCVARRYFSFALRRQPVTASLDSCVVEDLAAALDDSNEGLLGAFSRIARQTSFFTRKVGEP